MKTKLARPTKNSKKAAAKDEGTLTPEGPKQKRNLWGELMPMVIGIHSREDAERVHAKLQQEWPHLHASAEHLSQIGQVATVLLHALIKTDREGRMPKELTRRLSKMAHIARGENASIRARILDKVEYLARMRAGYPEHTRASITRNIINALGEIDPKYGTLQVSDVLEACRQGRAQRWSAARLAEELSKLAGIDKKPTADAFAVAKRRADRRWSDEESRRPKSAEEPRRPKSAGTAGVRHLKSD